MRWLIDLIYLILAIVTSPLWLVRMIRTGKIKTDWPGRFGRTKLKIDDGHKRLLLHAVSVGEVYAIRTLVERLAEQPGELHIVVAATTDTGWARANALFSPRHHVVRYPFDVSLAVDRFLDVVRPHVVALVELEVWPNFTSACVKRGIPVGVINGRFTRRSADRYRLLGPLIRPSFRRLAFAAVQNQSYAQRFCRVGVPQDRVVITGTMKWDTAEIADDVPGADELATEMGIDRTKPLVVAGSTAPREHELLVEAIPRSGQLLCAPRRPEWFDQAAAAMPGCARRSRHDCGSSTGRFLLDTIGELRQAYALADVVVIGRSFVDLHGSDMMEPVALGKATIVGPAVSDFQDTVDALLAGNGIMQTDRSGLPRVLRDLLDDPQRRALLAGNGRVVIRAHQGASDRNVELIRSFLDQTK